MNKYVVYSRVNYGEEYQNCNNDYIIASNPIEAIEYYKEFLIENGCTKEEIGNYDYEVRLFGEV